MSWNKDMNRMIQKAITSTSYTKELKFAREMAHTEPVVAHEYT